MKRFCKCFAILCLAFLVTANTLFAYAEQRITGCGFVDDDDCFAEGNFFYPFRCAGAFD